MERTWNAHGTQRSADLCGASVTYKAFDARQPGWLKVELAPQPQASNPSPAAAG